MMIITRTLRSAFVKSQINLLTQSRLLRHNQYVAVGRLARMLSSYHFTKNIEFLTHDNHIISSKSVVQNVNATKNRPLLIILSWLMSKRQHVLKFVNLYMEQGFDVVVVSLTPWQLLWPTKGSQLVAIDLLSFLEQNESYEQILLHGFSIGGYMWGEVLDLLQRDKDRYNNIADKIIGQVWDSIADIGQVSIGMSRAVFPRNKVLQSVLYKYIEYHMKTFHNQSTQYYIRSSQVFHTSPIRVPALFFISKADPVGTETSILNLRDNWETLGIKTYVKIFEKSPHVAHFYLYPKEYVAELYAFLQKLNLIQSEEKIKARL
ncbi:uncharacterized protein LOC116845113 [Odontomachus brunneus]|uniref:uncharacterized protein LOC116845113 n=1 Tax=Odontomachus brunneus TaxID=486640 RepID=UPI0013F1CDD6|nr:uncharacterized protein LOC116845113 [Odontomachus brunneus]XP_032673335.1 uncharacterized protein LOC116845113 [Odontomachus brunneus]XP_032673337.1 uncharacterized protein LOC116845113 [Odontomachus brunneus]XP_032673338.1 uncharacterized protein LOC116845113 [Odontomachus brunneus]